MKPLGRLLLLILLSVTVLRAFATHYRAGEILYTHIGTGYTYQVTVITYTKISGISIQADRDFVVVGWGDGTSDSLPRVNGPIINPPYHDGVIVLTDVKKNMYEGIHTYPGPPGGNPNGI